MGKHPVAAKHRKSAVKKHRPTAMILIAVAIALLVAGGVWLGISLYQRDAAPQGGETTPQAPQKEGDVWVDTRTPTNATIGTSENIILWPWEDKTDEERYTQLIFDGKEYRQRSNLTVAVKITDTSLIGDKLADGKAYGMETDSFGFAVKRTKPCEIYAISVLPDHRYVAVKYEGMSDHVVFAMDEGNNPPATFGEFLLSRALPKHMPLTTFTYVSSLEDEAKQTQRSLNNPADSAKIWALLQKATLAPRVETIDTASDPTRISFSATSEALGVKNRSFTVYASGYISTNIEDYGYFYRLDPQIAKEIINYATTHMTQVTKTPTQGHRIMGTITQLHANAIIINDGITLANPDEGIDFVIDTSDKRISRWLTHLSVGDVIAVELLSPILCDADGKPITHITNAYQISEAIVSSNGNVSVPE